jgi:Na+-transporting NADH:ubiquinone oxidoreductase subunit C
MSDRYIFRYIIILVVIVSVLLSAAAMWLQPYQKRNELNEQRINILKAAGITGVDNKNAEQLFNQHCTAKHEGDLPYYIIDDKVTVIPMHGNGLWGPIWGYLGLSDDLQTVVGAVFDHKSETPGLGAEITTEKYQSQYRDKPIDQKVDAIAGATRTSNGVEEMIERTLNTYLPYLEKQ